jgi:hypothetical protein
VTALMAAVRAAIAAELRAYYLRRTPLETRAAHERTAAIFALYALVPVAHRGRACDLVARRVDARVRVILRHPALDAWMPDLVALGMGLEAQRCAS